MMQRPQAVPPLGMESLRRNDQMLPDPGRLPQMRDPTVAQEERLRSARSLLDIDVPPRRAAERPHSQDDRLQPFRPTHALGASRDRSAEHAAAGGAAATTP